MKERIRILMVGPHPQTKSGLSACIRGYLRSPLAEEFSITTLSTYEYADKGRKFAVALKGLARFAGLLTTRKFPIVHIHTSGYNSFYRKSAFIVMARLYGKRILLHMHSSQFQEFYESAASQAFIRWVLQCADVLIVLSQSWKRYFSGLVHNRIEVIPTAFDTASPLVSCRRRPKNEILFIGGYWRRKGVFDLIEAVASVACKVPDVRLVFIGFPDEVERKEAEALWSEKGLNGRVEMLGWVDEAEKFRRLETAGVFVLPSYGEGMPMSIMEAMAAGVPVVSTPVGGIPEVVEDGKTGYLVPPGNPETLADRIEKVLSSPALALRMGREGRERVVSEFDLCTVTRKVANLYQELNLLGVARLTS